MGSLLLFLQGLLVGFLASVPLGPIGVICIQRTLSGTHKSGFFSGLGAATADTIFATLAVFSLSFLTDFMELHKHWFTAIGGILIIVLGFSIFYKRVKRPSQRRQTRSSLLSDYLSILFLTLTNPAYILVFITLFAALGISSEGHHTAVNLLLILGVLIGAACWWFTLTYAVSKLRRRFRLRHLWWINKITGAVIIAFGMLLVLSIVVYLGPVEKILP
ncbi:LysE family translocator [Rikenella microfusus]|uniref:Threonine efflux system n=1 Tax=Rikenella microfusus TaxID=28139 RepID=A0A379MMU9_9BACT|nr:LysE family transporter [Rikenella microfusus]SUE32895.1 threonine efflux system [Rikenella microfusus]HJE88866.1 LysE family translocator [Rikenella microfusus]